MQKPWNDDMLASWALAKKESGWYVAESTVTDV